MGLFNRRQSGISGWLNRVAYWQVAIALIAVSALVAAFGAAGREAMKYDRLAIVAGECGRAFVFSDIPAQRGLAHWRGLTASRITLPMMKAMFAGRSARRRIR